METLPPQDTGDDGMTDTLDLSETGLTHTEWLRNEIAQGSHRQPGEVTDEELVARYVRYGNAEWEPRVAEDVRVYLSKKGYSLQ